MSSRAKWLLREAKQPRSRKAVEKPALSEAEGTPGFFSEATPPQGILPMNSIFADSSFRRGCPILARFMRKSGNHEPRSKSAIPRWQQRIGKRVAQRSSARINVVPHGLIRCVLLCASLWDVI
jgi:hypothetical protein